ncbi:hypothetical protein BN1723_018604, partial [Verticillium longisporum]
HVPRCQGRGAPVLQGLCQAGAGQDLRERPARVRGHLARAREVWCRAQHPLRQAVGRYHRPRRGAPALRHVEGRAHAPLRPG